MASRTDTESGTNPQRSLRFPLLFLHLLLILGFGLGASFLVRLQLITPLEQQRERSFELREQQAVDKATADLQIVQQFSTAFHAVAVSNWGKTNATEAVVETLLKTLPADSAIIAAGIWPEPRSFAADSIRNSFYWTRTSNGDIRSHGDYNQPDRISYFGELWYAPLRWHKGKSCHFTSRYKEPFLQRQVIACSQPIYRGDTFLGVTSLVVDPALWASKISNGEDQSFAVLLDSEQNVLLADGITAQASDNLASLGQRDGRFGNLAVQLHQRGEQDIQAARSGNPNWDQDLAELQKSTRNLSAVQAATLLARLQNEQPLTSKTLADPGGLAQIVQWQLPAFGSLLIGASAVPMVGPLSQFDALGLIDTLGFILLAILFAFLISNAMVLSPLRRLVNQLQMPAEHTQLESGNGEFATIAELINLRHRRIRELLERPAVSARVAPAADRAQTANQSVLNALADAVVVTDDKGRIEHLNAAAESMSGWALNAARGMSFDEVFHISDRRGKSRLTDLPMRAIQAGRRSERPLPVQFTTRSGHQLPITLSSSPLEAPQSGVVFLLHDTRNDKVATSEAAGSVRDSLTGMLNRQAFDVELASRCEATRIGGSPAFHLLYLNIDKFNRINTNYGTEAGDELLRQLARLIQSDVGSGNPVYRIQGDKFGILLDTNDSAEAQVTAELLRADAQSWGFQWKQERSDITVSIGVVKVDRNSGRPVDVLRSAADLCQKIQLGGGGKVAMGEALGKRAESRDDRVWLNNIKRGLSDNLFHLSTQQIKPIQREMDAAGAVFDTSLQLEDDEGFWSNADVFMPVAERHQMAMQLDQWTFDRILQKLQSDDQLFESLDFCMLSVSLNSMQSSEFLDYLMERFRTSGISRSKICLDLAQNHVQECVSAARDFIQAMSRAGCRVCLSGVTTEPSSYNLLRDLPVNLVRIDPAFTRKAHTDAIDRLATEALHRIIRSLDKKSIVTDINSPELLRVVQGIGVDYAQGDAVARATPMLFQVQA